MAQPAPTKACVTTSQAQVALPVALRSAQVAPTKPRRMSVLLLPHSSSDPPSVVVGSSCSRVPRVVSLVQSKNAGVQPSISGPEIFHAMTSDAGLVTTKPSTKLRLWSAG